MSLGYVLWEGPSELDRITPIVAIATSESDNTKTGPMWQVWILRQDVHPMQARTIASADEAICGDCKHRPAHLGTCYVNLAWAPAAVWRAYKDGKYTSGMPITWGASVRLGAYGDPAAMPVSVLRRIITGARGWTGYTHQWRTCAPGLREYLMASVDTPREAAEAQAAGWRTFRVRTPDEHLGESEITCPASAEAGHRTTCAQCLLCMGTTQPAKHIAIQVHGQTQIPFYTRHQLTLPLTAKDDPTA